MHMPVIAKIIDIKRISGVMGPYVLNSAIGRQNSSLCYENSPEMTENCGVRVTYKRTLLPKEINSHEPEFKPVSPDPRGGLRTKRKGQIFM
eukprot:1859131-Pleurochrysis_carterae.AAC.1